EGGSEPRRRRGAQGRQRAEPFGHAEPEELRRDLERRGPERIPRQPERRGARHRDGRHSDRSAAARRRDRVSLHAEGVAPVAAGARSSRLTNKQRAPGPGAGGSCLGGRARVYRLTWTTVPVFGAPVPGSPFETTFTQSASSPLK